MKIKTLLTVLAIMMSLVITGCSSDAGSSGNGEESATVDVIMPSGSGTEGAIEDITKKFEEENPDIDVNVEFVAYNSLKQKVLTSAKSGDYDVTIVDQPWVAQFANAQILQKIPEELPEEDKKDIFDSFIEGMSFNGDMYAMPWKNDTKFLFYNKAMLKEAGFDSPPETWAELEEQSKALKEQGIVEHPAVWSWSQSEALVCDFVAVTGGYGGDIIENQNPQFTSEGITEGTTFMASSLENGISNPNSTEYLEQDVLDTFINEQAAFGLNWSFMYNEVKKSDISDQLGVTLVPGSDEVRSSTVYGGEGLGITSGSDNPEAAWKYIQFLTSKKVQKKNVDITLPIWKSLYEDEEVLKNNEEMIKVASKQFDYMKSRPKIPAYGDFSQSIQVEVQEILTGVDSVDAGLSNLQEKAEDIIK
ncbi:extracellular solute-binding protein [Halobacillus sp. BBL2006]|uniref:extracellular solute-binding protein n=1 Tax=Halobacillus sp. BBL2006 TaxID=1543706 RepID=UPI0005428E9D|nr:extracellular solute-binding protein [Halobacillus sp. BBL2006]KHE71840.1 hypothetical protein LD39_07695 [Halobacillus sp. BBL2006]